MENKEIIGMANEAYRQGFRDGFEYGSGRKSPYAQGEIVSPYEMGTGEIEPSTSKGTTVQIRIPASNLVDVKDLVDQINKQMRRSPRP